MALIIPESLAEIKKYIFDPCTLLLSDIEIEKESQEYGALRFNLDTLKIIFRKAKTTPTKNGQFVTLWKRDTGGSIVPLNIFGDFDFVIINAKTDENFGQFVFPKSVLKDQKILSDANNKGKLAFRIYPPWDKTASTQAQKTQIWQLQYFLEIPFAESVDFQRVKLLYHL